VDDDDDDDDDDCWNLLVLIPNGTLGTILVKAEQDDNFSHPAIVIAKYNEFRFVSLILIPLAIFKSDSFFSVM